jgi:GTPase-activating protein
MRHIEWRIRFFDEMFEKEIPNLFKHFKALDVTTEMFLLDWFLSLFSVLTFSFIISNLCRIIRDADIVSRIWDCFFLEGDVFAIKTALAILKYFELELKMLTFDGVTNFLWKLPKDMDEEMLFDLIEKINIPWSHYQKVLEHQKVADVNTQIHQALLI